MAESRPPGSDARRADAGPKDVTVADQHPARAYLGLALLGWGLSILLAVAPDEDPLVGLCLLVIGAALFTTASRKPRILRVPPIPLIAAGALAVACVLAYDLVRDMPLGLPKLAILSYGFLLVTAGLVLADRRLPRKARTNVGTGVVCSVPVVAAPLLAWSFQATFKATAGATPVEAFVHWGLLMPLRAGLELAGWDPVVEGQTITYVTPSGPLALNVGAACSGVQAMALFSGVLALYLFLERPAGRSLAVWSGIGLLGVYLANLERIAVIAAVGYGWGPAALLQVHAQAGWIFFVAWSVFFAALVRPRGAVRRARSAESGPAAGASGPRPE